MKNNVTEKELAKILSNRPERIIRSSLFFWYMRLGVGFQIGPEFCLRRNEDYGIKFHFRRKLWPFIFWADENFYSDCSQFKRGYVLMLRGWGTFISYGGVRTYISAYWRAK